MLSNAHVQSVAAATPGEHPPLDPARASAIFEPLRFRNLDGQEPHLPLERRGPVRQLRRLGDRGPDQLGPEVRARRSRRDHLVERADRRARAHHPGLRVHRLGRDDPVLARARPTRARARLQVRRPAGLRRPRADDDRPAALARVELERPRGADQRVPRDADDRRRDPVGRPLVRRRRPPGARGGARRGGARRRERDALHAVPLLGDQRPRGRLRRRAREPRSLRARGRARDPDGGRRRLLPRVQDLARASGCASCSPGCAPGNTLGGVAPGLQVARGSRRRHAPRLDRRRVPASAQPGRPLPGARHGQDLRRAASRTGSTSSGTSCVFSTWPLSAGFRWWWERPARSLRRVRGDQPRRTRAP